MSSTDEPIQPQAVDTRPALSVVVPAYNERGRIGVALQRVSDYLTSRQLEAELIVVDDGSRDGTLEEVRQGARTIGRPVKVVAHATNQGKGAAVRRGVSEASGELVLFCDADMATPIEEFSKLEAAIRQGADVAIGTRKARGARIERRQPRVRELLGRGFTWLTNLLVGIHVSDVTCGFKCFRHEAARTLFARQRLPGWSFDAEVLYLARRAGFTIREVPVRWADSGQTKVRLMRDIAGSFMGLVRIRLNDLAGRYR